MITNKQYGKALELYYHKNLQDKVPVGRFLCYVFKIDDLYLKRSDTYSEGCRYFKATYVEDQVLP
jgi:hypothetical protein